METMYPYRVAWHKPEAVEVSPESRRVLLEALEYEFPTSRHRLAGLCGLGDVTLRRGCRQLIREGVLTLKYGPDPDTGKACDLITPVCYPILPAGVSLQWTAYALNTPSLAHRGALRYARRALWECMAGKSRQAAHE